ncbi:helix-turn-helix domain-containing protein [Klebsiella sp. WOUb02]|uniref:helix-turn-helix domain-containing protein n=1 Tax=Klebsiella sp. WOUb02 TaxID=3161071 RepID=UPI003CEFC6AE
MWVSANGLASAGNAVSDDRRPAAPRPVPKNRLSAEEEQLVLAVCHEPRFASLPPAQIVPVLADEGRYIASESTFYRVLRRYGEVSHRGRQQAPQSRPLSTWKATAPNQVWSWDITWLKSLTAGHWFYPQKSQPCSAYQCSTVTP